MCDQLRADYLSCYGHPSLHTPHIDALAARGVRFAKAYAQAPQCGPSRASFYTGRYMSSHGSFWNRIPLRPDEKTIGSYLGDLGYTTALVGKSHMKHDQESFQRLGVDASHPSAALAIQAGFLPYNRDDGLNPDRIAPPTLAYNQTLKARGYTSDNPWQENANNVVDDEGNVYNGWLIQHADLPANVREEDSETAYMTDKAMEFIEEYEGQGPWCLHLSYIKPHWPYVAPAPYHELYGEDDIQAVQRSEEELASAHPVFRELAALRDCQVMAREETRQKVIPAYMGLVKQIDDHIGRLTHYLEEKGLLETTVIVFTSDHGDYLGDHFLSEKLLFHDPSVRIPLIVCDPSPEADGSRGTVSDALVEAIDLLPSLIDLAGGDSGAHGHRLEGHSLLPLLHQQQEQLRDYAVAEIDYAGRQIWETLGIELSECRAYMLCDARWKYVFFEAFDAPQLFDMDDDPHELNDLGRSNLPEHQAVIARMREALFQWLRRRKTRVTVSDDWIKQKTGAAFEQSLGLYIGYFDEEDLVKGQQSL